MPTRIHEIEIRRTARLGFYRDLDHLDPLVDELHRRGREVAERLGAGRVWMLNSTATGGGVAELLPRLCALMGDAGVDTRWLVLEPGDPDFFHLTKSLHNMLHGFPGERTPAASRELYERVSAEAALHLRHVARDDVLVIHDPQPAGAAVHLRPRQGPRLVWRCHVGIPEGNEHSDEAWEFLRPYLRPFERMVFSAAPYIPDDLLPRSEVIPPGIDPLSHKNRTLRPYKLTGVLRSANLVEGPPVAEWARFKAPVERFSGGRWIAEPIPHLLHLPLIVQISRFDRLKGFQYLIPAFAELLQTYRERIVHLRADTERVRCELEAAHLVLAGPDPSGVADDPEAGALLEELCAQQAALPPEIGRRVHLLRLPMVDIKQNALVVNALQRLAAVVVQNSLREGFGLTVSEALWKRTPVVAANVGGIAVQMRHETDGLLVHDPTQPSAIAEALLLTLARARSAEAMARSGRGRVREHFLVLAELRAWLRLLEHLLGAPRPAGT